MPVAHRTKNMTRCAMLIAWIHIRAYVPLGRKKHEPLFHNARFVFCLSPQWLCSCVQYGMITNEGRHGAFLEQWHFAAGLILFQQAQFVRLAQREGFVVNLQLLVDVFDVITHRGDGDI